MVALWAGVERQNSQPFWDEVAKLQLIIKMLSSTIRWFSYQPRDRVLHETRQNQRDAFSRVPTRVFMSLSSLILPYRPIECMALQVESHGLVDIQVKMVTQATLMRALSRKQQRRESSD